MPEGDRRGEVDFHDYTYDGVKKGGMLYKGLGQLADGEYGQDNFRLDLRGRGIKVKQRVRIPCFRGFFSFLFCCLILFLFILCLFVFMLMSP